MLCLAGRNDFDEAAAALLAQLLSICGVSARLAQVDDLAATEGDMFHDLAKTLSTRIVCVSCISDNSAARARLLVRKLRRKHIDDTQIMVGFWGTDALTTEARLARQQETGADLIVTSLNEALNDVLNATPEDDGSLEALAQVAAKALSKTFEGKDA